MARDFLAALAIGVVLGCIILRVFFSGAARVLGFWGLLALT